MAEEAASGVASPQSCPLANRSPVASRKPAGYPPCLASAAALRETAAMFADVLLPLALVLIMGSLGMTLTPADFRRIATAPKGVGIGLANLLLLSPLLAFVI